MGLSVSPAMMRLSSLELKASNDASGAVTDFVPVHARKNRLIRMMDQIRMDLLFNIIRKFKPYEAYKEV
jgi:hypothetical protein